MKKKQVILKNRDRVLRVLLRLSLFNASARQKIWYFFALLASGKRGAPGSGE